MKHALLLAGRIVLAPIALHYNLCGESSTALPAEMHQIDNVIFIGKVGALPV